MTSDPTIAIPLSYVIAAVIPLTGAIVFLHRLAMDFVKMRLDSQDATISDLKSEVKELSKGCGLPVCRWATKK